MKPRLSLLVALPELIAKTTLCLGTSYTAGFYFHLYTGHTESIVSHLLSLFSSVDKVTVETLSYSYFKNYILL